MFLSNHPREILLMKKYGLILLLLCTSFLAFSKPPPAAEVFQLSAHLIDPNTFSINWLIKPGFFLYKKRINITPPQFSNIELAPLRLPTPLNFKDSRDQTYLIYRDHLSLPISILGKEPGESLLNVHYQGCSDKGFCYPPIDIQIKITIDINLNLSNVSLETTAPTLQKTTSSPPHPSNVSQLFSESSWGIIMLSFFGLGLLLSFTPCVLPMVPVLSSIIVGHGKDISTRKAFFLSLSYVLSMSVTYSIIGAMVALMGMNLQIAMQSPISIGLFSLIFILLALSMFNVYELHLPVSWQARLANITKSHSGGHYLGAALMGCFSILILSPCVTAPLIGALGYIAQKGNVPLGMIALFFLSLGMGTPLLLIGTTAGKLLPKTGYWMNTIKAFFGVMMLAVAIYLLGRILPNILTMFLWSALLIFSGIFLDAFNHANSAQEKFRKGFGIILLVYGLLILVGTSLGHTDPLEPLTSHQGTVALNSTATPITVRTPESLKTALLQAKGRPVFIDYYADWCKSCRIIEATTLRDNRVRALLNQFTYIKVDVSKINTDTKILLNTYDVVAPPTFIFLNSSGQENHNLRLVGELSTKTLINQMQQALG
jgi:thiol:disulfide interchange protein DsbD